MIIERISDTQLKFVFAGADLEARDIKINELSYASDKTHRLFREIMQLVQDEHEFSSENSPLMFEAMRVGVDSIVVMVTKIDDADAEKQYNLIPAAQRECRFKRGGMIEQPSHASEDSHSVFSFESLDAAAAAVALLSPRFSGLSRMYKMENRYYLWLRNETEDDRTTGELEAVLYEFGQKHVSNIISRQYLMEHGEPVIVDDAVEKLSTYHNMQQT